MASKILTISINETQFRFLEENPDFSPSKLLQAKINELMETSINFEERMKTLKIQIDRLTEHRNKFIDFINSKELMEDFAKFEK